jgi:hypothetical protein
MILNIAPLSATELQLLLSAMKLANLDEKVSQAEAIAIEQRMRSYIAARRRNRVAFARWNRWGDAGKMELAALRKIWADAGEFGIRAVVDGRSFPFVLCPIPILSLPLKKPMAIISDRSDLFNWLFARAVANSQRLLFVKCKLCRKVGLRRRARVKTDYCSTKCQTDAALAKVIGWKKDEADLRVWLTKLPEPRPPKFEWQLDLIEKGYHTVPAKRAN